MTFAAGKGVVGAQPNVIVELDLDQCSLTYGTSPCTAANATGGECYNSRNTCQDKDNYDQSGNVITFRFSLADSGVLPGLNVYPCIENITIAPTKLTPGKGLSTRAKVDITLTDFTDNDSQQDPYFNTRNYIATDQGTFFGKLAERWPFYNGRALRVKLGYNVDSNGDTSYTLADYDKTLTYIVDRIEGPDEQGRVKIVGKDILNLTDALKSQVPVASESVLTSAINSTTGSIPVTDGTEYAATSGTASIIRHGDELIYCTGRTGNTLTGGTRGYAGTTAVSGDSGDSVQLCAHWGFLATDRVDSVVEDLLTTYAGLSTSVLNTTGWAATTSDWMSSYNLKNIISEPTDVKGELQKIGIETGTDWWFDDETGKVEMGCNVPDVNTLPTLTDDDIIDRTAKVKREDKERLSQTWFAFGLRDYTSDRDELKYFTNIEVRTDTDSEGELEYNEKGIKKVFCEYVQTSAVAGQQATRLLNRYAKPPIRINASVEHDQDALVTNQQVDLTTDLCQMADGSNKSFTMQVVSRQYDVTSSVINLEMLTFLNAIGRSAFITPTGTADYTTTGADANPTYSWICSTSTAQMPNGDEPYLII